MKMNSTVYLCLVVRLRVVYLYALPPAHCNASDLLVSQQAETFVLLGRGRRLFALENSATTTHL